MALLTRIAWGLAALGLLASLVLGAWAASLNRKASELQDRNEQLSLQVAAQLRASKAHSKALKRAQAASAEAQATLASAVAANPSWASQPVPEEVARAVE